MGNSKEGKRLTPWVNSTISGSLLSGCCQMVMRFPGW